MPSQSPAHSSSQSRLLTAAHGLPQPQGRGTRWHLTGLLSASPGRAPSPAPGVPAPRCSLSAPPAACRGWQRSRVRPVRPDTGPEAGPAGRRPLGAGAGPGPAGEVPAFREAPGRAVPARALTCCLRGPMARPPRPHLLPAPGPPRPRGGGGGAPGPGRQRHLKARARGAGPEPP